MTETSTPTVHTRSVGLNVFEVYTETRTDQGLRREARGRIVPHIEGTFGAYTKTGTWIADRDTREEAIALVMGDALPATVAAAGEITSVEAPAVATYAGAISTAVRGQRVTIPALTAYDRPFRIFDLTVEDDGLLRLWGTLTDELDGFPTRGVVVSPAEPALLELPDTTVLEVSVEDRLDAYDRLSPAAQAAALASARSGALPALAAALCTRIPDPVIPPADRDADRRRALADAAPENLRSPRRLL